MSDIIKDPARWIKADGTTVIVSPKDGKHFQLAELHEFVGGFIEIKRLQGRVTNKLMIINDEGKLSHVNLPKNDTATGIYNAFRMGWIAGDVLVCEYEQVE